MLVEGSAPGHDGLRRPLVPHSESVSPAGEAARLRSGKDLCVVTVAGSALYVPGGESLIPLRGAGGGIFGFTSAVGCNNDAKFS